MSQQSTVGSQVARGLIAVIALGAIGYAVWWRLEHERSEAAAAAHRKKLDGTPIPGLERDPNATSKDAMKGMPPAGKQGGPMGEQASGPMADASRGGDAPKRTAPGPMPRGNNSVPPSPPDYRDQFGPKPSKDGEKGAAEEKSSGAAAGDAQAKSGS